MKIFIVGGTGVLGRRLVPLLVERGFEVGVLSRSEENRLAITQMGANPVQTSLFNQQDLIEKTSDYEIFLHLATAIPAKAKTTPKDWELNTRIRVEGTANLLAAAQNANCDFYFQQSIVFVYGHRGEEIIHEDTSIKRPIPTAVSLSKEYNYIIESALEMEDLVNDAIAEGLAATIFRFGWFYSHDSSNVKDIVDGNWAHVWRSNPYVSMIMVDDAVQSILSAIENYDKISGKTYNIVDNEPVRLRDFVNYGLNLVDKSAPVVPGILVRLLYNKYALNFLTTSYRVSNENIRSELGWEPEYPTYKEGLDTEIPKVSP